jgi:hypothetical protein
MSKYAYPLYEVIWDDAAVETGWIDPSIALQNQLVTTVGFLVNESEKHILIASTYSDDHVNATIQIPRGMVQTMTELGTPRKRAKGAPRDSTTSE